MTRLVDKINKCIIESSSSQELEIILNNKIDFYIDKGLIVKYYFKGNVCYLQSI